MTQSKDEKRVEFLPFHAINYFMVAEFRLAVVRSVLNGLPDLPNKIRSAVDKATRRNVNVPGFRNSVKAPASLKTPPLAKAFKENPDLVSAILSGWLAQRPELGELVFDLLVERGWELLPLETDHSRLPGFMKKWPVDEDFDSIYTAFQEKYPDQEASANDVSLMTVWLSGRLPVDKASED